VQGAGGPAPTAGLDTIPADVSAPVVIGHRHAGVADDVGEREGHSRLAERGVPGLGLIAERCRIFAEYVRSRLLRSGFERWNR
jgi:hypothetical protein